MQYGELGPYPIRNKKYGLMSLVGGIILVFGVILFMGGVQRAPNIGRDISYSSVYANEKALEQNLKNLPDYKGQLSPEEYALATMCLADMNIAMSGGNGGKDFDKTIISLAVDQFKFRFGEDTNVAIDTLQNVWSKVNNSQIDPATGAPEECEQRGFWFANRKVLGVPVYGE